MTTLSQIVAFLIKLIFDIYFYIMMLRLLLQKFSANWNGPIVQMAIKLTRLPLKIVKKFIPGFKGFDLAILALGFMVAYCGAVFVVVAALYTNCWWR